ncbi:MAG: hypothetical protein K0Q63_1799, partial [Paenibacillus sp.]|nr:hypothetical protein [Paenibacillus sp.]
LLNMTMQPANVSNTKVSWSSSDPSVAMVENGIVTAVSSGTAVVAAQSAIDAAVSATSLITVVPRTIQKQFYVAPTGDDLGPGTEEQPFRTLSRAQQAVRDVNDNMTGDVIVYVREGIYRLETTWELDERDSGTNGYMARWMAYPGEQPVLSGGSVISGWTLHDPQLGIYKAEAGTELRTRQLFIDGVRAVRARSQAGLKDAVKTAAGYASADVQLAEYARPQDLEFVYKEQWTNPRNGVASVSVVDGKAEILMDQPGWQAVTNKGGTSATYPAYYENAYELLDHEGEWYLNEATGELFYKPRPWEDLTEAEVVAPVLEELLSVKGSSVDNRASSIEFKGLTFADTTWLRPSSNLGHADAQNNHLRYPGESDRLAPAAITVERAFMVNFERNVFTRLGITALKLVGGVQDSLIRGNAFYDISGSAINVGDPATAAANSNPSDARLVMRNNDVIDNYIHDIGVDYMSAAAISAGFPLDMDIRNNEIFNVPYSGMHIGYGWDTRFPNTLRNMKIEHNFIHDFMGKGIYDGGAIYTLGNSGGASDHYNLVARNYIRNQMNDYGALYPDQGSTFWHFDRNVIDLSETTTWQSGPPRWTLGNSNRDVIFSDTYTTTERKVSNSPVDVTFAGTRVFPDADWPEEAVDIINRSGLTQEYADVRGSHVERVSIPSQLLLLTGEQQKLDLQAADGKDRPVPATGLRVYTVFDKPGIASINEDGVITALGKGHTRAIVTVLDGTLIRTLTTDIYVDEQLEQLTIEGEYGLSELYVEQRASRALKLTGISDQGRTVTLDAAEWISSEPDWLGVSEDGVITARLAGTYTLDARGAWRGRTVEQSFSVKVTEPGIAEPYALRAELADEDGWHVDEKGLKRLSPDGRSIELGSPSKFALYRDRKYMNELLDFQTTIHATSGWPSYIFRNQNPDRGIDDTTYIFTVKPDVLELQRFNAGERTVIYGNIAGFTSLAGDAIPNTMLPLNQRHRIQLGAVNEPDGVRLIVLANGQPIIDYLDTSERAIRGAGYFGVYARTGSITLEQNGYPDLIADAPRQATVGEPMAMGVGLAHIADSLHGDVRQLELTLRYDHELLDFAGLLPAGTIQGQAADSEPGVLSIRLTPSDIGADGQWAELIWSALQAKEDTRIELSGVITDAEGTMRDLLPISVPLVLAEAPAPKATDKPGKPVLSHDNGHDTGLRDGNFTITMNQWWGNNGTAYKLYENGALIDARALTDDSPNAQQAAAVLTGRSNGTYVYTCELSNAFGTTSCDALTVVVADALPGTAVLSGDNWDGDGNYKVSMNMWWGTNAAAFELYENGEMVKSLALSEATPDAQAATFTFAGKNPGTYEYYGKLINAAGETITAALTVVVSD